MSKMDWIWMPHPGHFICARWCRYHLCTHVNGYLISTVGEYWPDRDVRKILAEFRGVEIEGRGDEWDYNYSRLMPYQGYESMGPDPSHLYETFVFKAKKRKK